MRGIAAISRNDRYYILFEWADGGNLRDFWQSNPLPADDKHIMEFIEQMSGLSSSLARLHGYRTFDHFFPSASHPGAEDLSWIHNANLEEGEEQSEEMQESDVSYRHGDLKPDNILVFHDHPSWLGTLKIADFATTKFHRVRTRERLQGTTERFGTVQYEAPEAVTKTDNPRSRLFDVWSMGCILLESVIWLLYGLDGLDAFHDREYRLGRESDFYTITSSYTAVVNPRVSAWMDAILELDPECNRRSGSALGDMVQLVRDRLLVVELPVRGAYPSRTRINAAQLSKELSRIHERALSHPEYLFAGRKDGVKAGFVLRRLVLPKIEGQIQQASDQRIHLTSLYVTIPVRRGEVLAVPDAPTPRDTGDSSDDPPMASLDSIL
jgi:serine/threonine protein kinase